MLRRDKLKIKVIIPNAGMSPSELKDRERMLKTVARADTEISVDCIAAGPESIESHYDEIMASRYILERVKAAEEAGFDAIVIYCTSDPAVDAAREIVNIPVVGPGEVAIHLASILGNRFSYLTVLEETIPKNEERIRKSKIDQSCLASVRSLGIPVSRLRDNLEETKRAVIREGRKAVEEDGAQVVILGCMGLAGLGKEVQAELGVPVVDPAFIAVNMAELLLCSNLTYSRLAYPCPPGKRYVKS